MSVFASKDRSEPIAIPHDAPHTIVVRKLTGREMDAAHAAPTSSTSRGFSMAFRRILEGVAVDNADVKQVLADPLSGLDRYALINAGVIEWSYDTTLSPEAIDDLDDESVEFYALTVLKRCKPRLFQTPDVAQADAKND